MRARSSRCTNSSQGRPSSASAEWPRVRSKAGFTRLKRPSRPAMHSRSRERWKMLASSCSALSRRPWAAAKEAMVPFMPPSSCAQVPSNAATSARWPSRLSSIDVFMVLISPASRSVVTRSSLNVSATAPSSSRPAYRMSYDRSPSESARAPAETSLSGRVIDRRRVRARTVTAARTASDTLRSRASRARAVSRSLAASRPSSAAARCWMPRRASMRPVEAVSQPAYVGHEFFSACGSARVSRVVRTTSPGCWSRAT